MWNFKNQDRTTNMGVGSLPGNIRVLKAGQQANEQSMRIAIVAQNIVYGDGQGRINLEIVRHALRLGHKVILVSVAVDPVVLNDGAEWIRVHVRRKPILARVAQFPRMANRIVDRLRTEDKIDFVIANGYTLTRDHDLNLSQFVHNAWLQSGLNAQADSGIIRKLYQAFYTRYNAFHERRSYRAARIVVAPSMRTLREVKDLGIDPSRLRKIPNGVDCEEFFPAPPGTCNRNALGLLPDVPMALFAGDIRTNRKGLGNVLQAMTKLPGVHLAVVGRSDGSPFVPMAQTLDIADRVHFLGFRKDVPAIMRACDLFVFPSCYEPFGLVVTEALACGLPVVTTAATGAGELLTFECGTVIEDPWDIAALTAAMSGWLSDPARRHSAASACRSIAQANGWTAMATQYLEVLEKSRSRETTASSLPDFAEVKLCR